MHRTSIEGTPGIRNTVQSHEAALPSPSVPRSQNSLSFRAARTPVEVESTRLPDNAVDPNSLLHQLECQAPSESHNGSLGGAVVQQEMLQLSVPGVVVWRRNDPHGIGPNPVPPTLCTACCLRIRGLGPCGCGSRLTLSFGDNAQSKEGTLEASFDFKDRIELCGMCRGEVRSCGRSLAFQDW
ncbi:hypothetical protein SLEP1_g29794 [Rubroshorea leprosula]|uniref:Uncharacterized protein n=1 Tax=Rubroshorea leprosula TaxID=152421 RepID=A0AAV5K6X4_9ROSI|nr:hypothetical protein SLEP1_g29794 [Rubroshorea leprosula]